MNHKMTTRSSTQPNTIFYELPNKRTRPTTPPPSSPKTPSAPLKPMRLVHPDTIEPIAKNLLKCFTWEVPKPDEFIISSEEWKKNKKRKDNGSYVYTCGKPNPNSGRKCMCETYDKIGLYSGCAKHYMWEENLNKYMNF